MSAVDRSYDTLRASNAELRAILQLRKLQGDAVVALIPIVLPILNAYPVEKEVFEGARRNRGASMDALYRGLFVIALSAFEGFVKQFVSALAHEKAASVAKFSDLEERFRNQYVSRAGQVLSSLGSGTVQGIPYNFKKLQKNLGKCLVDSPTPQLNGEVYTMLMGNPTSNRIEIALRSLGIDDPFDKNFFSNKAMKTWGKQAGWRAILDDAKANLDKLIDDRNLIVHASQPISIVEQDILEGCEFFEALASALVDEMPSRL